LLPLIGIIIFIYLLTQVDIQGIGEVFTSLPPLYIFLSFLSVIPILLFVNVEWQLILRKHNIHVSFWYSLKNILIGYFYGFITPGGFGAYTRALYLHDETGESAQKCFVNILIFNTIDYLALLTLGVIGGFVLSSYLPSVFPIFLIVFIIIIILIIILLRKETGQALFTRIIRSELLSSKWKEKWGTHIERLYQDIPSIKDLLLPYSIAVLGWFIWFTILFFIAQLFAITVPWIYFIFIIAVANVLASIPISIYGLGIREASLFGLFSLFQVDASKVISLSLFWFVLMWLSPSIIGTIVTFYESKKHPKVQQQHS